MLSQLRDNLQTGSTIDEKRGQFPKHAAVLIALTDNELSPSVILTRRADHLNNHSGEVALPGGKWEDQDESLLVTALRETHEEIGIPAQEVEIVGQLPEYRTISGYTMQPVIGMLNPNLPLALDTNEVEEAFEVPLSYALDRQNHFIHWVERGSYRHPIYFIPFKETYIWGATAALIRTLSNHIMAD